MVFTIFGVDEYLDVAGAGLVQITVRTEIMGTHLSLVVHFRLKMRVTSRSSILCNN